jgi:hypothetical protein
MNLIILAVAILVSLVIFTWLLKVMRATLSTALTLAILVLAAQLLFGIGPGQIWQQITLFFQWLWQLLGNR